ncbi:hypothetical protein HAX54_001379 [Datura stramonium]|uniref:Uncharacterized protein n=1 Tax=Datura stramonium TaxID=4076 RepID=A0ABS8WQM7_DATST|nr:hypothetical protein [Datura stramonium]
MSSQVPPAPRRNSLVHKRNISTLKKSVNQSENGGSAANATSQSKPSSPPHSVMKGARLSPLATWRGELLSPSSIMVRRNPKGALMALMALMATWRRGEKGKKDRLSSLLRDSEARKTTTSPSSSPRLLQTPGPVLQNAVFFSFSPSRFSRLGFLEFTVLRRTDCVSPTKFI